MSHTEMAYKVKKKEHKWVKSGMQTSVPKGKFRKEI
jgi:hypothetical protein